MKRKQKIGVIGAGISGLAASIRMAAHGHEVSVFEASNKVGGKLHEFQLGAYRFDFGPSLFTMPQLVEELFALCGKDFGAYFQYYTLETICNYFWDDGTTTATYGDLETTIAMLADDLGEQESSIRKHFANSKKKYELVGHTFLENSLHKWQTWLTASVAKAIVQLPGLDVFTTMHKENEKQFSNPKTVQLFDRYATYNGSNPYKAPGLLNIIPHFEYGYGAHLPVKGMHQITEALYKLANDMGVVFYLDSRAEKINIKNDKNVASLTIAGGETHTFDTILSNMDAYFTYKYLLDDESQAAKVLRQERSSSAMIFYWGIDRNFPQLDLHNIFFSNEYEEEFEAIADGKISDDPTVYVNITSKYVQGDAPPGHENWFTMINVPYNSGQDWDSLISSSRAAIIKKINHNLKVDIEQHIMCETIHDPRTIESKTLSYTGSLYGTSSNSKWAAFARHPNQSSQYNNLFFIGGSVHPGGGLPLCLLSAKIVDELINGK